MTDVAPTSPTADHDPVAAMLHVLDLSTTAARTTEDIFTGSSLASKTQRLLNFFFYNSRICVVEPEDFCV